MAFSNPPLKIGTRGSKLARAQAEAVRAALLAAHGAEALGGAPVLVVITTSGDVLKDRPLRDFGGKGLFTKEIDEALSSGAIDLAVHSAKDMPTQEAAGLLLAACLERSDVRDLFIGREVERFEALPKGAGIGTSALRRRAQLLMRRRDIAVHDMRGNIDTRLKKLAAGECDGLVLAAAGLARLNLRPPRARVFEIEEMLPAAGQGAVAICAREDDERARALLAAVDHAETRAAVTAERAFLGVLDGSCRSPIAAHARFAQGRVRFSGLAASEDGGVHYRVAREGLALQAVALARDAADEIRARATPDFLKLYLSGA